MFLTVCVSERNLHPVFEGACQFSSIPGHWSAGHLSTNTQFTKTHRIYWHSFPGRKPACSAYTFYLSPHNSRRGVGQATGALSSVPAVQGHGGTAEGLGLWGRAS
ncbi:hypothetical protein FQN60_005133 [Etheostoma spectabile]|uniref:Uncharacterized protein n=1 Tax=Etheostoma spectabile TaxID=54343 RepID=A0A5J5DMA6_9PERO|nr:hypothetical protein FQN60_005133 [Etheostoma spectabile]